ncbi:hypothetical protein ACQJBY_060426 [Aegilops geniculata]
MPPPSTTLDGRLLDEAEVSTMKMRRSVADIGSSSDREVAVLDSWRKWKMSCFRYVHPKRGYYFGMSSWFMQPLLLPLAGMSRLYF